MSEVVSLAGDSDTNCAIVGAMIGAYVGIKDLDSEVKDGKSIVHAKNSYLKKVVEFDCQNPSVLRKDKLNKRPDFLNIGRYAPSMLMDLVDNLPDEGNFKIMAEELVVYLPKETEDSEVEG